MTQVGSVIANWLIIAISTFLMILERKNIGKYILSGIPINMRSYVEGHYIKIQHVFTSWLRAMFTLSLSIFLLTYIGLFIIESIFGFSLEKTFTLAIIGGIMEFIPYA